MLTTEEISRSLPPQLKISVSQELVDLVNNIATDPEAAAVVRENFISYTVVLKDGKFKTEDYVHAVTYVSFKLMGYSNQEAYVRTFPVRYQALMARGASAKDVSAYVAAYNKNKLVNLIMEQTLVPTWVLNHDVYQKAINVQADLMMNAKSEKVRSDAANSLLTHIKRPEKKEVELRLDVTDKSGLNELRDTLREMAVQQQQLIEQGVSTKDIAHQNLRHGPSDLIEATARDVTPKEE